MATHARTLTGVVAVTIALVLALATSACVGPGRADRAPQVAASVVATTTSTTEGRSVTFTVPTVLQPTTTVPRTTTTLRTGLPAFFPIPAASTISLGGDSQLTNSLDIRGVDKATIVRWLRNGLAADGWQITHDDGTRIDFTGPGAVGAVAVDPARGDVRLVRFALGGR
jgi:hypothetical protein